MKILSYPQAALFFLLCCSSCVGAKKYKALEAQNEKITTTLLETKEELSVAKRNLNKLEDKASASKEQSIASIESLQIHLQKSQAQLKANQKQLQALRKQSSKQLEELQQKNNSYKVQLKPYLAAKATLKKEQNKLTKLYVAIEALLAQDSTAQITTKLLSSRLVVTFEHSYLFGNSERTISSLGRQKLEAIAALLQEHPAVSLDILGHSSTSNNALDNWKSSTRKPLVVLYTLLKAGAAPERIRLVAHGSYLPLVIGNGQEVIAHNARTELIFHYQGERFVPTLVNP